MTNTVHPTCSQVSPGMARPSIPCVDQSAPVSAPKVEAGGLQDHVIRETVNQLRDIAIKYHAAGQLREQIAYVIVPLLKDRAPAVNAAGQVPDGFELVPVAANVDEVVSRMYRRFKDWSKRGFGPEDVTWCEVRADVLAIIAKANAEGMKGVRRPEVATLADSLQRQNPSWSRTRALTEAKARVTENSGHRAAATSAAGLTATQALIALGKYASGYRPGQDGWTPEDDAALAAAMGDSAPATSAAGLSDSEDAARWRETLMHVGGTYVADGVRFTLRYLHPLDKANIMRGSVASHFTEAIDAARKDRSAAKGAVGQGGGAA